MRVSVIALAACCIGGASLATALPSSLGATLNGVRSINQQQEPKPEIVQRQPAKAIPPNANVPPFQSNALVDGNPVAKRSVQARQDTVPIKQDPGSRVPTQVGGPFTGTGTGSGGGAVVLLVIGLMEIAADLIDRTKSFNEARKTFTQQQPELMWTRNPDYAKFPAAACYGLGYRLANETAFDGLIHANISGPGKEENYDCLYLEAPNQFFTNDDGGSLNLGVAFDPTRCSFDSETADLTCTH
ncbi:hypothetical protein LZ32DRAFT_689347 [Colletotrichum eremochloae]|nr:hypothetical protein LZ32DRAFT_689347 [Colletotrichum eremochloae]